MQNDYSIFDLDCNSKETGPIYPQIQKMSNGYNSSADNSIKKLFRYYKSFPEFTPNLESFVLHPRSKRTDILSNSLSFSGLIVNLKVKEILESIDTCPKKFYKASVMQHNKLLDDYFWMHIVSDYTDFVDYAKSSFFIYQNFMHNIGNIKILSKEDLKEKEERLKKENPNTTLAIWSEKIKMTASFDQQLQFFLVGKFDSNMYIGNSLQDLLIKNRITGYKIRINDKITL